MNRHVSVEGADVIELTAADFALRTIGGLRCDCRGCAAAGFTSGPSSAPSATSRALWRFRYPDLRALPLPDLPPADFVLDLVLEVDHISAGIRNGSVHIDTELVQVVDLEAVR